MTSIRELVIARIKTARAEAVRDQAARGGGDLPERLDHLLSSLTEPKPRDLCRARSK